MNLARIYVRENGSGIKGCYSLARKSVSTLLASGPRGLFVKAKRFNQRTASEYLEEITTGPTASLVSNAKAELECFLASGNVLRFAESANPTVSVVLVLFNRAELTLKCLKSLSEFQHLGLELIIVDNASSDATERLLDAVEGVKRIDNEENEQFVRGCNKALAHCCGKYVLFLNNDTQLLPGALDIALTTIEQSDDIGAVGGKLVFPDGSLQEAGSIVWSDGSTLGYGRGDNPLLPQFMFQRDTSYCSGAFLLTPRDLFEQLGGFDTAYSPAYYEDADYCMKVWESGKRVVYEPRSVIIHHEFASSLTKSHAIKLQLEHREVFKTAHQVSLSTQQQPAVPNVLEARAHSKRPRVLFIDDRVPYDHLGSGFPRARAMIETLVELECDVTLYPLRFPLEDWRKVYDALPRSVEVMLFAGVDHIAGFLEERKDYYDSVIVSRPHNMELVSPLLDQLSKGTRIIYDAEAIATNREVTQRALDGRPMPEPERNEKIAAEIELANGSDVVLSVSEFESRQFCKNGIERVEVVSHQVECKPGEWSFEQRRDLLFVGPCHCDDCPNADAIDWFANEILPIIRNRIGEIQFRVVGRIDSKRIRRLKRPGLQLEGRIRDLASAYNSARLFVAPTRFAAGIPLKIYDAAAHGLPIVCTNLLANQLGWKDQKEILTASDPEAFAERCLNAYGDQALWERLRHNALEATRSACSQETFKRAIQDATLPKNAADKMAA